MTSERLQLSLSFMKETWAQHFFKGFQAEADAAPGRLKGYHFCASWDWALFHLCTACLSHTKSLGGCGDPLQPCDSADLLWENNVSDAGSECAAHLIRNHDRSLTPAIMRPAGRLKTSHSPSVNNPEQMRIVHQSNACDILWTSGLCPSQHPRMAPWMVYCFTSSVLQWPWNYLYVEYGLQNGTDPLLSSLAECFARKSDSFPSYNPL